MVVAETVLEKGVSGVRECVCVCGERSAGAPPAASKLHQGRWLLKLHNAMTLSSYKIIR